MLEAVGDWLGRLYPTNTWGELDDELAVVSGVSREDVLALADEFADELKGAVIFREGSEEDLCDYLYILCQGREPCALQMGYGGAPVPEEFTADDRVHELYLRVSLSCIAPMVVVQQVSVTMSQDEGQWLIQEELAAGVYDAPLLKRFQRLVALLPAYDLVHLDMGEISTPPPDFDHGDYGQRYGSEPHQSNYLFFRNPSTMSVTTLLHPNP